MFRLLTDASDTISTRHRLLRKSAMKPFLFYNEDYVEEKDLRIDSCSIVKQHLKLNLRNVENWKRMKTKKPVTNEWRAAKAINNFLDYCLPNKFKHKSRLYLVTHAIHFLATVDSWDDGFFLWVKRLFVEENCHEDAHFIPRKYFGEAVEYITKRVWMRIAGSNVRTNLDNFLFKITYMLLRDASYSKNLYQCHLFMIKKILPTLDRMPIYAAQSLYSTVDCFFVYIGDYARHPQNMFLLCRALAAKKHIEFDNILCTIQNVLDDFCQQNDSVLPLYDLTILKHVCQMALKMDDLQLPSISDDTIKRLNMYVADHTKPPKYYCNMLKSSIVDHRHTFKYEGWNFMDRYVRLSARALQYNIKYLKKLKNDSEYEFELRLLVPSKNRYN
ncbi:p43 [Sucra jujuba nucleopolyhedrovirus]|uniref:p43 n=1 Tax=Sucra jujuba nucleopolyhedrovirus TaxID=1563660 RepID=A0A097P954_9ABAC|nr:p43 [Sucra jujuba nucleopolyhedrovirus]AIU41334.1 p43 [Sucra jujuba nucleopolyhedrovirus]